MRALCASLPSDWWMTGDDGNRLALALCSVCPALKRCLEGDPGPHGVIRAGVAYDDGGRPLALCGCGYPAPVGRLECFRCEPREKTPVPVGRGSRPAEPFAATIRELLAAGWTYRAIALRIGSNTEAVRGVARRHGWRSSLRGRPQVVSTEEDAA